MAVTPAMSGVGTDLQPAIAACLDALAASRRNAASMPGPDGPDGPAAYLALTGRAAQLGEETCIGYAAGICTAASEDGTSTLGTAACLRREAEAWNARLNRDYGRVLAIAPPTARDGYRRAARAWLAFRDATCRIPANRLGTHDRVVPLTSDCILSLTARQALRMQRELAELR